MLENFHNSCRHKIIVNADDFGVSPRANRNILHLISIGKIDRVSVMAYGQFSEKQLEEIIKSQVKLDIHLDILHEFHENRRQRQGAFLRITEFLGKLFTGKLSPHKVREDWSAQIEKFREIFNRYPDGINSHEHVHFFPPFFKIVLKLQEKYSIPYVRFGDSVFMLNHKIVAYILHCLRILNLRTYRKSPCISSDSLVSLDWINDVEKFLNNLPEGKTEIACHPELAEDFVKLRKYF